jgi:hypothetical protein
MIAVHINYNLLLDKKGAKRMINIIRIIGVGILCITLISCATTGITGAWKDKDYNKPLTKVLVIGMSDNIARRRIYEDTLVKQFEQNGITAISSAALFSPQKKFEKDELEAAIKENSFDAVLVTRLVSVEKDTRYVRGTVYVHRPPQNYYYNFYDYYGRAQPVVYSPGYLEDVTIVSLETNIYETEQENLIWSISSETFNPGDVNRTVKELSKLIVNRLSKDGLL